MQWILNKVKPRPTGHTNPAQSREKTFLPLTNSIIQKECALLKEDLWKQLENFKLGELKNEGTRNFCPNNLDCFKTFKKRHRR